MKSILHEFAYGNINPAEHSIPKTQHYKRTLKKLNEYDNTLQSSMDEKAQELFKLYTDALAEIHTIDETDKFIYGFKLGVLVTAEVFVGRNSVVFGGEDGQ